MKTSLYSEGQLQNDSRKIRNLIMHIETELFQQSESTK